MSAIPSAAPSALNLQTPIPSASPSSYLVASAGEYPLPKFASALFRIPVHVALPFWRYRRRWDAEYHVLKSMFHNNLHGWQAWSQLRDIKNETLVITGERDNYFPRYVYDDVAKLIPGAEVHDIGSAKHKVQLERHEAVNRAIERFVETSTNDPVGAPQRRRTSSAKGPSLARPLRQRHPAYDSDSASAALSFSGKRCRLGAAAGGHRLLRQDIELPRAGSQGQSVRAWLVGAGRAKGAIVFKLSCRIRLNSSSPITPF